MTKPKVGDILTFPYRLFKARITELQGNRYYGVYVSIDPNPTKNLGNLKVGDEWWGFVDQTINSIQEGRWLIERSESFTKNKCECGGTKLNLTHSHWCPIH